MKKYTIQEVAKLLADKTHAIYCDVNEFDLLRKILKLAFPKDEETDTFEFKKEDPYYGYCRHDSDNWANIGRYLEELQIIKLSKITDAYDTIYDKTSSCFDDKINDIKVNDSMQVETVTISKEDYDRFLLLEKMAFGKISDEKLEEVWVKKETNDLLLENKKKKSDQKFLDKCAIGAMNGLMSVNEKGDFDTIEIMTTKCAEYSYIVANAMLTEKNR